MRKSHEKLGPFFELGQGKLLNNPDFLCQFEVATVLLDLVTGSEYRHINASWSSSNGSWVGSSFFNLRSTWAS